MGIVENSKDYVSNDETGLSFLVNGRAAVMVHVYSLKNYAPDLVHERPAKQITSVMEVNNSYILYEKPYSILDAVMGLVLLSVPYLSYFGWLTTD